MGTKGTKGTKGSQTAQRARGFDVEVGYPHRSARTDVPHRYFSRRDGAGRMGRLSGSGHARRAPNTLTGGYPGARSRASPWRCRGERFFCRIGR